MKLYSLNPFWSMWKHLCKMKTSPKYKKKCQPAETEGAEKFGKKEIMLDFSRRLGLKKFKQRKRERESELRLEKFLDIFPFCILEKYQKIWGVGRERKREREDLEKFRSPPSPEIKRKRKSESWFEKISEPAWPWNLKKLERKRNSSYFNFTRKQTDGDKTHQRSEKNTLVMLSLTFELGIISAKTSIRCDKLRHLLMFINIISEIH